MEDNALQEREAALDAATPQIDNPDTPPQDSGNAVDRLDSDLSEYNQGIQKAAAENSIADELGQLLAGNTPQEDPLDALLREANANDPNMRELQERDDKINSLNNELAQLRNAEHQRRETEAFIDFGREIVGRVPDTLPAKEEFVEQRLINIAATDETARLAWQMRGMDQGQLKGYSAKLEVAWNILQRTNPPNRAQLMQHIQNEYRLASIGIGSKTILANIGHRIVDSARRAVKQGFVDQETTEDRALIAQSMKSYAGKAPEEPPPDIAHMSTKDFEDYKRKVFKR